MPKYVDGIGLAASARPSAAMVLGVHRFDKVGQDCHRDCSSLWMLFQAIEGCLVLRCSRIQKVHLLQCGRLFPLVQYGFYKGHSRSQTCPQGLPRRHTDGGCWVYWHRRRRTRSCGCWVYWRISMYLSKLEAGWRNRRCIVHIGVLTLGHIENRDGFLVGPLVGIHDGGRGHGCDTSVGEFQGNPFNT